VATEVSDVDSKGHDDGPPALRYEVAVPLIAANGALDAYTFLAHDGVFATAQTGNVVLFAIGLIRPAVAAPWPHLWPILAFVAGIAVARSISRPAATGGHYRSRRWVLVVQVLILVAVGSFSSALPLWLIVSAISFASALQLALFRKIAAITWVTIAMTGNLMRTTESVHAALTGDRDSRGPAVAQLAMIVVFAAGVVLGAVTTTHLGGRAAFVPAALLAADLVWIVSRRGLRPR
jgi:uncharacterized membrane protein YoaK (UPF0700 family)